MKKYVFKCEGCDKEVKMSLYCVAQLSSGNILNHTCTCGHKTKLSKKYLL